MTLSKEQIEAIQARADNSAWDSHPTKWALAPQKLEDMRALCQQALRAIELEAEVKTLNDRMNIADEAWADQENDAIDGEQEIQRLQSELTTTRNALEHERERCAKEVLNYDGMRADALAAKLRALPSPEGKP